MRIAPILFVSACAVKTLPADQTTDSGTPSTTSPFTLSPDLVMEDDANLAYSQEWTLAASEIRANAAEVYLSWEGKPQDAWDVQRADDSYDKLLFLELAATRDEVVERLAIDDLDAVIVNAWEADVAGETDLPLSATGFDPPTQLPEDTATSWLVALVDDAGSRNDVRDGVFLVPRAAQPGINLAIPDTAGSTSWSMLFGNDELRTDSGHERYSLDFGGLTVDGYGKPFDVARVDRVFVGRFEGVDEADDLGGDVLDLQAVASGWWTVGSGGFANVDLALAQDDAGGRFPGFTTDAQWLVGGFCSTCLGPAPMFLGIVVVRDP